MNSQKGFGLVEGLLIMLLTAAVGFGVYNAWSQNNKDSTEQVETVKIEESNQKTNGSQSKEVPNNQNQVIDKNSRFQVTLPKGWKSTEKTGDINSGTNETYKFANGNNYFEVNYVIAGRGAMADLFWAYRVYDNDATKIYLDNDSLEICDPITNESSCSSGDNRLDIFIKGGGASADSNIKVNTENGNHTATVSLWAGNSSSEKIEDALIDDFRSMVNSLVFNLN